MENSEDIRNRFEKKVKECYAEYYDSWMKLQPKELIERESEIHAICQMTEELPELASERDVKYLLRFKNPLEVASDAWYNNVCSLVSEDELDHVLWELCDRRDAEYDYEMEPEFYDSGTPELSM